MQFPLGRLFRYFVSFCSAKLEINYPAEKNIKKAAVSTFCVRMW